MSDGVGRGARWESGDRDDSAGRDHAWDGSEGRGEVELSFMPLAGHVRTARLVVAATARRAGFDETRLDAVRLATGEACARAVGRCQDSGVREELVVRVHDSGSDFVVEVVDRAGGPAGSDNGGDLPGGDLPGGDVHGSGTGGDLHGKETARAAAEPVEDPVVVALLSGLADRVDIGPGPGGLGGCVRLRWSRAGHTGSGGT